jgi:glycosyltransferase involved in cell wall biosynthesis
MTPTICVAIPAYRAAGTVERAIRSVLDQDVDGVRVLVLDDASPDETADVAESVRDPRVVVERNPINLGRGPNVHRALMRPTEDLVAVLPADCELTPGSLVRRSEVLADRSGPGFVFGAADVLDDAGRRLRDHRPFAEDRRLEPRQAVRELLPFDPVFTSTALMRREAVHALGGLRLDIAPSHRDWDLFLRMAATGGAAYTATPCSHERQGAADFTTAASAADLHCFYEYLVLEAFSRWARAHAPAVVDEVDDGLRRWADAQVGAALRARQGVSPRDPDRALALAVLAWPSVRSSARWRLAGRAGVPPVLLRGMRRLLALRRGAPR